MAGYAGCVSLCNSYSFIMFASVITDDRCDLFTVLRTDVVTNDCVSLTYPPSDFPTAVRRARVYQQSFDPARTRYDYRVTSCG